MLKITEKTELNQISLTGTRALALLGLLMDAPRTFEEIKQSFINFKIMEPSDCDDIIRIDLNTLRTMGCEITRASAKTGYKYVLKKHPFALTITEEEIVTLKKVYKKLKERISIYTLLKYDELFKKLANHVSDEKIKEELFGLSILKSMNLELIKELIEDCKQQKVLTLEYLTPSAKEASRKEIAAQKVVFKNDKVYLYGYDFDKKEASILNVKRIQKILSKVLKGSGIEFKTTCIKFFLKSFGVAEIDDDEKIVETLENGFIVEGKYYNEFLAAQRILSFGSACTVLEPQDFRKKIIQKLKSMRNNYNG